jgi:hypothetical protein
LSKLFLSDIAFGEIPHYALAAPENPGAALTSLFESVFNEFLASVGDCLTPLKLRNR